MEAAHTNTAVCAPSRSPPSHRIAPSASDRYRSNPGGPASWATANGARQALNPGPESWKDVSVLPGPAPS